MGLFYGWVVLGAAMLLDMCTAPAHSTGLNIFFDDLMTATTTPRASLSLTCKAKNMKCSDIDHCHEAYVANARRTTSHALSCLGPRARSPQTRLHSAPARC